MITEMTVKAKVVIPTKSRIAAWWMLIVGGILGVISLAILLVAWFTSDEWIRDCYGYLFYFSGLVVIAIFIVYFIPGLLVLKGGRWGWIISSVILSLPTIGSLVWPLVQGNFPSPLLLIAFCAPLILILSDHISYKHGGDINENHQIVHLQRRKLL